MTLTAVDENGVRAIEGVAGDSLMATPADINRVVETAFSERTRKILLYPSNLTPAFFDVSSREAGEILQKLRTYKIRMAVVCAPGSTKFSSRFNELLADERRHGHFDVFETRAAAREWLAR